MIKKEQKPITRNNPSTKKITKITKQPKNRSKSRKTQKKTKNNPIPNQFPNQKKQKKKKNPKKKSNSPKIRENNHPIDIQKNRQLPLNKAKVLRLIASHHKQNGRTSRTSPKSEGRRLSHQRYWPPRGLRTIPKNNLQIRTSNRRYLRIRCSANLKIRT